MITLRTECIRPPYLVHNTRKAYQEGCTCPGAIEANRAYSRAWRATPAGQHYVERKNAQRRALRGSAPNPRVLRRQRRQASAIAMHERGWRPGEIARELGVSTRTVERYLTVTG